MSLKLIIFNSISKKVAWFLSVNNTSKFLSRFSAAKFEQSSLRIGESMPSVASDMFF